MKPCAFLLFLAWLFVSPLEALTPGDLRRVRFDQHPGQQISRDLVFQDETGRSITAR